MTVVNHRGTIRTNSRLMAWYLSSVRGNRVRNVWSRPAASFCGILIYEHRWVLDSAGC